jgi:hypothetical protein
MTFGMFDFHTRENPPSSADLASAHKPYIDTCITAFGVDRGLFESNFPPDGASSSWNAFKLTRVQPQRLPRSAESGIENCLDPWRPGPMRARSLFCLLSLVGCVGSARVEGFGATGPTSFQYSAHTNTVMTENDDGTAERLRRDWIADALKVHAMCPDGYVVDTRHFAPGAEGPFGNGGEILYAGRCL